tara:strand:+ start:16992 stop:17471 length:480 start_codon:yes stop_codon:yes gene_type:complete
MSIKEVLIEEELEIQDLKVRGFVDLAIVLEDSRVFVYDIKTINDWSYKLKFGRKYKEAEGSIHQELQLATYGLALEDKYGRVDGLYLVYYNKNTSMIKQVEVSKDRLTSVMSFWRNIIEEHKNGLPDLKEGVSPVMAWECNYCRFKTKCQEDIKNDDNK